MKALFVLLSLFSVNAFATSDGMTSVWIVVQNVQEPELFSVQAAPVIGCYGLAQGPQLEQFVSEYNVKQSVGCGWETKEIQDINALSCAETLQSVENSTYTGFKKIVLDISKCDAKNNKNFITMIRTAAKRNFPQKSGKDVELVLKK
jgi:hypothetical protein